MTFAVSIGSRLGQGAMALEGAAWVPAPALLFLSSVLTSSKGFITNYLVLKEGRTPDGSTFKVTIKANVAKKLLEDRLSALRILHKKMGNK